MSSHQEVIQKEIQRLQDIQKSLEKMVQSDSYESQRENLNLENLNSSYANQLEMENRLREQTSAGAYKQLSDFEKRMEERSIHQQLQQEDIIDKRSNKNKYNRIV